MKPFTAVIIFLSGEQSKNSIVHITLKCKKVEENNTCCDFSTIKKKHNKNTPSTFEVMTFYHLIVSQGILCMKFACFYDLKSLPLGGEIN